MASMVVGNRRGAAGAPSARRCSPRRASVMALRGLRGLVAEGKAAVPRTSREDSPRTASRTPSGVRPCSHLDEGDVRGCGRLRRQGRPLLRPHSTGSTGSSTSSTSSVSSVATAATSFSSSSWSSASREPPLPPPPLLLPPPPLLLPPPPLLLPPPPPLLPPPQSSAAGVAPLGVGMGMAGMAGSPLADQGVPAFAMAGHPVTRRTAKIARELYSAWSGRVGPSAFIPSEKVQQLFNDMQLYPTNSEVMEMLHCAQQCAQRSTPNYLTFGEFCVFATELKRCVDKGLSRPAQLSRLLERDGEKRRARRKVSKGPPKHEVFLGGSCNPTTWRHDVAIPLLKNLGISYFNPQVSDWTPELVEKEHYAKQNAAVLFFVLDNQTRNTASTVEVSFFSGLKRSMVLVVHPYQPTRSEIAGEAILHDELEELAAGQQVMEILAEKQGIPVFPSIPLAINGIAKVLWENVSVQDLLPNEKSTTQISDRLMKLREAFDAVDSERTGEISLSQVRLAFWILNSRNLSISDLRSAGVLEKEAKENVTSEDMRVNFDQFCAIVAEFKSNQERWSMGPVRTLKSFSSSSNQQTSFDVYLGGSSFNTSWRDDVAIPLMKKNGLRYIIPPCNQWNKQIVQSNITLADRSSVVLYIITETSRSLAELNMAAYYIGLGYDVVLYVGLLTEQSIVNGKLLSKLAVKDYNRGRTYLRDLAVREGVPVLDSISAALEFAASKCLKSNAEH